MDWTTSSNATGGSSHGVAVGADVAASPTPPRKKAAAATGAAGGGQSSSALSPNLGKRKRAGSINANGSVDKLHTKRTAGLGVKHGYSLTGASMAKMFSRNGSVDNEFEDQLVPTKDQSIKLARVVRMLDKHGISLQSLPEEAGVPTLLDALDPARAGWPHSVAAMEFYLDLALSEIQTHLAGTEALPDTTKFCETLRGLLEDVRQDAQKRLGISLRGKARPAKFSLHRIIGNDMDVFSSTIGLPVDTSSLEKLSDTDVIAIHAIPAAIQSSSLSLTANTDTPELKDINPYPPPLKAQPTDFRPRVEPVSFLYYDAYASFAPTYDSGRATMSYAQSVHVRNARQTVRDWEKRIIEFPPLPSTCQRGETVVALSQVARMLYQAQSTSSAEMLSEEDIMWALTTMEASRVIDERLNETACYLKYLQEAQWARLRASEERGSEASQRALPIATAEENAAAQHVIDQLSGILNARPRVMGGTMAVLPKSDGDIRRLAKELVQSHADGYYGSLDTNNAKAVRNDVMTLQKVEHEVGMQAHGEHGSVDGNTAAGGQSMKRTASQKKQRKKEKAAKAAASAAAQAMTGDQ